MKVNFYIDGFNLYYGALKGTPYRWLNLGELCTRLLPRYAPPNRIRYFTALVKPRPNDRDVLVRQQTLIRALETVPNLSVHYGQFLSGVRSMPLAFPPSQGPAFAKVVRTDEKGSDVNLASYLLVDGFKGDYDMAVVVSNDSDLCEPIQLVQSELGLPVGVYNPQKITSWRLQQVATFYRSIRGGALAASQFPPTLHDENGQITKPQGW